MPSVTDVQQQSSSNNGKTTPSSQQQAITDTTNVDPITQAILALEKKQRNLGKRKEKLESYQQEAKSGKELHKDQKEALAKYAEVLGQIECTKDLSEQFKKIQAESSKNQKRLTKQAAEEKRLLISQRLREYAQLRYLLDHRPTSLKPEESSLFDELSRIIVPTDNSTNTISRSVDTVLSIYQGGPAAATIKTLTGKNPQEVRELIEQLMQNVDTQTISLSSSSTVPPPQQEQVKEVVQTPTPPPTNNNNVESSSVTNLNEYPLQFDTRNQKIPLEQIIEDNRFFSIDLNNQTQLLQDNNTDQSSDPKQYLQTFTVVNSGITEQPSSSVQNQQQENLTNDQQQIEEQWQHQRGTGNANRAGQYNNAGGNRNYNRGGQNNYNQQQQQQWRGPREGRYDGGQRQYHDNNYRGRGGSNSNYRGSRGGNRGGNGGYYNNGDGYQKSAQYQQNNEQHQARSAHPAEQQHQ